MWDKSLSLGLHLSQGAGFQWASLSQLDACSMFARSCKHPIRNRFYVASYADAL